MTVNIVYRIRAVLPACIALLALATHGTATAQTVNMIDPSKTPKWQDLPDWNGVWERDGHNGFDPRIPIEVRQVPPYKPEFLKEYNSVQTSNQAGKPQADRLASCLPNGMPAMMTVLFPMEIRINPTQTTMIFELFSQVRRIHTDGRGHPKEPQPSTVGHSIGQWKNGELFVDTCCFSTDTKLPGRGPHSDAMFIKEHFWSPEPGTLKLDIEVHDPKAFTKPWVAQKTYRHRPDWEAVEYLCGENNRNPIGDDGVTSVVLPE